MSGRSNTSAAGLAFDRHLQQDRLLSDLSELVSMPSVNPFDGPTAPHLREREIALDYERRMRAIGLETEIRDVVPDRPNVWGRLRGSGAGPTLILAGHLDTVGVGGYADPFSGKIEGGSLYGRGACDMKAALAAFLEVVRIITSEGLELPGDLLIVGLCDEEHMMLGSREFGRSGPKADFAIVGEPTSLSICPAHSGQITLFLRTFGKAVHSSRPEKGENAIVHMGRVLAALDTYDSDLSHGRHHALCGYGRFSPGVIRGGTISSAVPDFCELEVDRRTLPGETLGQVLSELHERIDPLSAGERPFRYEIAGPGLDVSALDTPQDSPVVVSLSRAFEAVFHRRAEISAFAGGTDAPYLGCPAVICGPGNLAQAHTLDEFVDTRQVVDAVRLYLHAIFDLMGMT